MKKVVNRSIALALAVIMTIGLLAVGASAADTVSFTDIANSSHAHAIEALAEVGIMKGVSATRFDPNGTVTRAQAVTVLGRMAGVDEELSDAFDDVDNSSWYAGYVGWAAENGIVEGVGNRRFMPDDSITGQQMDLMLERYAALAGFRYTALNQSAAPLTRGELAEMVYFAYVQPLLPAPTTYSTEIEWDDMFGPQPGTLTIDITTLQWTLAYENMYASAEIGGWYDDTTYDVEITNDGGQGAWLPVDVIKAAVTAGIETIYEENNISRPVYTTNIEWDDMFGPQPGTLTINTSNLQWTLAYENMYASAEIGGWYDDLTYDVEITNDGGQGAWLPVDVIKAAVTAGIQQIYADNNITAGPTQSDHTHRYRDGVCVVCGEVCEHPTFTAAGVCTVCNWRCTHPDHDRETLVCNLCDQIGYHSFDENGECSCGLTSIFQIWNVPEEYTAYPEQQGTVEDFYYDTRAYALETDGVEIPYENKHARVYLPYGYDETKQYDIYYLMHGGGGNETEWLADGDNMGNIRPILDNMIANGEMDPIIVVTPTFYYEGMDNAGTLLTENFWKEFMNDLVPAVESEYATYANGDVSPENLKATRAHRAYSGLSMGSMTSFNSILLHCTDYVGYVGSFSAGPNPQSFTMEEVVDGINEYLTESGNEMYYWFNGNGTQDMAHDEHQRAYKYMMDTTTHFVDGVNTCWIDMPDKAHAWNAWTIDFYNTLKVFFQVDESGENPALDALQAAGTLH